MASATANIIVLGTYYNPVDAHLARTRLEAAGIACFVSNESLALLNQMYSPASGGVRLHVYARDAARATEVLREPAIMHASRGGLAEEEALPGPTCPRCHSTEVVHEAEARPVSGQRWATLRAWLRRQGLLHGPGNHCFNCGLDY